VIILGSKHSGKRSLIESLFDISKTNIVNKRLSNLSEGNKIRLKGITTAIDYAYLNVIDPNDADNRTHRFI
jgi:signal recognition particle receptor subunit beta